ncbi:MAG: hypothetical protein KatS3mg028_1369 [Bacteroidia bacterium]|nr:MAG: hypothetical protein KatS3mg028_1369 [Bacteroidia bacterium]
MFEVIGDKQGQAIYFGNIGSTFLELKQYRKAVQYLKKAELLNKELETLYFPERRFIKLIRTLRTNRKV